MGQHLTVSGLGEQLRDVGKSWMQMNLKICPAGSICGAGDGKKRRGDGIDLELSLLALQVAF